MDPTPPDSRPLSRSDLLTHLRRRLLAHVSIRQRLALWYATLLALTLVMFSVIVYTVAQNQLQTSVNEEIKNRASYIAGALQGAQDAVGQPAATTPTLTPSPSASVAPSPSPAPSSTATPNPTQTGTAGASPSATVPEPSPIPTVDPKSSAKIENILKSRAGVLGRIDLPFEVLNVKGTTKFVAPVIKDVGLPLNVPVIDQALQGTPGMYTAPAPGNTGSLLAIYVQPITVADASVPPAAGSPSDAGNPTGTAGSSSNVGSPTDTALPTATISPNTASQQVIGVVLVAKPLDDMNSALNTLSRLLIVGSIIAVLFALIGGWFIAESGMRPVSSVTRAARAIAASAHRAGLGTRVNYSGPRDEIGELVVTFNEMLEALERVSSAQRRFVADASHELRAPLTTIKTTFDFLRQAPDLPGEDRQEMLEDGYGEAERMAALVNDLLLLARVDAADGAKYGLRENWLDDQLRGRREPVELDQLAMEVFRQGQALVEARRKNIHFSVLNLEPVTVLGDPGQLRQLAVILIDNAIKYTPAGGKIRIAVSRNGNLAAFSITDTGIGIPPEARPHIFERFYRADQARVRDQQGSGLGLAIGKWIAETHQGEISVHSQPGQGSTFTVLLPAIRWSEGWPATSPQQAVAREPQPSGAIGNVARLVRPRKLSRSKPNSRPTTPDEEQAVTEAADEQQPHTSGTNHRAGTEKPARYGRVTWPRGGRNRHFPPPV
ncbi:MAG TPA: HAMP domain-containing sensor histidine kinase [Ktedonobacterales bacterium]